jgi:hypothetical protein
VLSCVGSALRYDWIRVASYPILLLRRPTAPGTRDIANLGRDALADAGVLGNDATITILRTSPDDAGFREVFVSVDGEQLAILRHGESVTADVKAGSHWVRAHNTLFWKTHQLVLKPREHAHFMAVNRTGWGAFGFFFFLGAMPVYLTFERVPSPEVARPVE